MVSVVNLTIMQTMVVVNEEVALVVAQAIEVKAIRNANMEVDANEWLLTAAAQAIDIESIRNVNEVATGNVNVGNKNIGDEIVSIIDLGVTQTIVAVNERVPLAMAQVTKAEAIRNANMEADANEWLPTIVV